MVGGKCARDDHSKDRHRTGPRRFGCLCEGELSALLAFAFLVDSDIVMSTERAYTRLGPGVVLAGTVTEPIEQRRDAAVRQQPRQFRDQLFDFDGRRPAMLAGAVLDHAEFRVVAALDRKSTRLNSSHLGISYAVFC